MSTYLFVKAFSDAHQGAHAYFTTCMSSLPVFKAVVRSLLSFLLALVDSSLFNFNFCSPFRLHLKDDLLFSPVFDLDKAWLASCLSPVHEQRHLHYSIAILVSDIACGKLWCSIY